MNLLSAPLEVSGAWGQSPPADAAVVISRMREACLSGLRLLSDHQPDRLRVDYQASGPPHIWLHTENPRAAWIVVDIATRAWSLRWEKRFACAIRITGNSCCDRRASCAAACRRTASSHIYKKARLARRTSASAPMAPTICRAIVAASSASAPQGIEVAGDCVLLMNG